MRAAQTKSAKESEEFVVCDNKLEASAGGLRFAGWSLLMLASFFQQLCFPLFESKVFYFMTNDEFGLWEHCLVTRLIIVGAL